MYVDTTVFVVLRTPVYKQELSLLAGLSTVERCCMVYAVWFMLYGDGFSEEFYFFFPV